MTFSRIAAVFALAVLAVITTVDAGAPAGDPAKDAAAPTDVQAEKRLASVLQAFDKAQRETTSLIAGFTEKKQLKLLAGHLKEGQFVTKIRKTFTKGEMEDDLLIMPAKLGQAEDKSEYEEILPTSPP